MLSQKASLTDKMKKISKNNNPAADDVENVENVAHYAHRSKLTETFILSWSQPDPTGAGLTSPDRWKPEKDGISIVWLSYLHQWHLLKVELVFCISYHIYTIGINGISLLQSFTGDGLFRQMLI